MTKPSRPLVIGIAGLAVAGVAAAMVVSRHKIGGSASSDQAIRRAAAALSAGDADALLQLGDPIGYMATAFDCSRREARKASKAQRPPDPPRRANDKHRHEDDDRDDDDPQKLRDRLQKTYAALADKARGLKIEVAAITEKPIDGKSDSKAKGDEVTPGCIARTALTVHQYAVTLRVQDGDKPPADQAVTLETIEAGGRYYLFQPPEVVRAGAREDVTAKLDELSHAMCQCTDMACAQKVQADMLAWSQATAGHQDASSDADRDKQGAARTQLGACFARLAGAPPSSPPPGEPPPAH